MQFHRALVNDLAVHEGQTVMAIGSRVEIAVQVSVRAVEDAQAAEGGRVSGAAFEAFC